MTGRELIIYILEHGLENESLEDILPNAFLTEEQAAKELEVGIATVRTLYKLKKLPGLEIGDNVYIFKDYKKMEDKQNYEKQ